ncbi:hypothetical protein EYC80_007611 [Monilinia laxa]|uniref:Uncharacterized protein n=1 Tax=Monilinia laxa TaxID=61186 RepID=A0A5N6JWG0_MONLA|nr:hypothetical protein EYC80_007611 [Monilinia laxa]
MMIYQISSVHKAFVGMGYHAFVYYGSGSMLKSNCRDALTITKTGDLCIVGLTWVQVQKNFLFNGTGLTGWMGVHGVW